MRRAIPHKAVLALGLVVAAVTWPAVAGAAPKDKSTVRDFASGEVVVGSFSMLDRSTDTIATSVRTSVGADHAGDAYTMWYVIFNAPDACSGGMCGEDDVFDMAPGNPFFPFNEPQIKAVDISVVWAAGDVANQGARLSLDGGLTEGEVPGGPRQVVIGKASDGALVPLSDVTGLTDAEGAEVHLVLQSHGPASEDPAELEEQTTQFDGACNPDCVDTHFAIHM